jgi:hypothetical protein
LIDNQKKDYIPFGPEWIEQMKVFRKIELIKMLKSALCRVAALELAEELGKKK